MQNKGFEAELTLDKTPNDKVSEKKPLKSDQVLKRRVDINVLKARAQAIQNKESTKSTIILVFIIIVLGIIGFYFST